MRKSEMIRSAMADFKGDFTTAEVVARINEKFQIHLSYTGSFFAKFEQTGMIRRVGIVSVGKKSSPSIVWRGTDKLQITEVASPLAAWSKVWPEFFKQYPVPVGRVYKLEM